MSRIASLTSSCAVLLALLSGYARAQALPRAVSRCPAPVTDALRELRAIGDETTARSVGGTFIQSTVSGGEGLDGGTSTTHLLVDLRTCSLVRVSESFANSEPFVSELVVDDSGQPPPIALVRQVVRRRVEVLDANRVSHGLVRRLESVHRGGLNWAGCPSPFDTASGAIRVARLATARAPWLPGRPGAAPAIYDPRSGRLFDAHARPRRVLRASSYELGEVPLASRYDGRAVAVYDRSTGRHAWVLVTVGCVVGRIRWMGRHGAWLFGVADSPHPEWAPSLFALSLTTFEPFVIALEAMSNDDNIPVTEGLCPERGPVSDEARCLRVTMEPEVLQLTVCSNGCQQHGYPMQEIVTRLEAASRDEQPSRDAEQPSRAAEQPSRAAEQPSRPTSAPSYSTRREDLP